MDRWEGFWAAGHVGVTAVADQGLSRGLELAVGVASIHAVLVLMVSERLGCIVSE